MKQQPFKTLLKAGGAAILLAIPAYTLPAFTIQRSQDLSFSRSNLEILPNVTLKKSLWQSNETIVFIHPPKTAGTNLVNLMEAVASVKQDVIVKRAAVPRISGRSPNLFTEGSLGGLSRIMNNIGEFNGERQHLDFISGHMPIPEVQDEPKLFGVHKVSYIGLVRNPIDREISAANFDFQRGYIEQADAAAYLLERAIDNPQTRLIAGQNAMTGKCTADTLEKAKKNIQNRFKFIAPIEDIGTVMAIVANHFGMSDVAYAQAQVTGLKAIAAEDNDLYAKLTQKHQYDLELYHWVKAEWAIWKERHIESISSNVDPTKHYLSLMPDFSQTQRPKIMDAQQLSEYNRAVGQEILPIHQNHTGLSHVDKVVSGMLGSISR